MPVSISNITTGNSTGGGSSVTTASITPSGNNLILVSVTSRTNITTDPNQPTITGCGLTWVAISSIVYDTTGSTRKRITLFRAMGASPSTGALTIDFGGQNQTDVNWIVDQASNVDTTGTNGSGAVVQSATNKDETVTSPTLTVTLSAFGSSNNGTYGTLVADNTTGLSSAGSGFTQLGNVASSNLQLMSEYKNTNDTTVDATFNSNAMLGGIAIEIKASGNSTTTQTQTGKARIQQTVSKTQSGIANIIKDLVPQYDHVVTLIMENTNYTNVIGNTTDAPYINNTLLPLGSLLTNYYQILNESLTDYLALTSGSNQGITTDVNIGPPDNHATISATNIVDRLEAASISWKAYMEDMPSNWYTSSSRTMGNTGSTDYDGNLTYQEHHNPFIYYTSNNNAYTNARLTKVVPYTQLATDLAVSGGTGLPKYVWITPRMDHDMHDAQSGSINRIKAADNWLSTEVPHILNSDAFTQQNSLLVIVWDEDEGTAGGHIPCILIGQNIKRNFSSSLKYDHYSLLRTIEYALGHMSPMQTDGSVNNDKTATIFSDVFISNTTRTKTQTGVANILGTTTRTQTGKARIAGPAPAKGLVQSALHSAHANSNAASFPGNVTNGNLIVVAITQFLGTITSLTDNQGNTYTQTQAPQHANPSSDYVELYYAKNVTGGPVTVTASFSGTTDSNVAIFEYSGFDKTAPLDQSTVASGANTHPLTTSLTPTVDGSLLFSVVVDDNGGNTAATPGAHYTLEQHQDDSSTHERIQTEDYIQFTSAPQVADFTLASSSDWAMIMAVFKPAAYSGIPVVVTNPTTGITPTTAMGNGSVTSDGGFSITECGVVIATAANPTTANTKFTSAGTTGTFSAALSGLAPNTTYHLRAYATNSQGTAYGDDVVFTTTSGVVQAVFPLDPRISYTPQGKYQWQIFLGGRLFVDLTGLCEKRQVIITRNDSDEINFTISIDQLAQIAKNLNINVSDVLQSWNSEVRVSRYGTVLSAGEVQPWQGNVGKNRKVQINAPGWLELMKWRKTSDEFINQSALAITKTLFANTLLRQYGSAGNYNGMVLGATPAVDNTNVYDVMPYSEKTLYDAFTEFASENNGYDIEFTWDKRLNIYHPSMGVSRNDIILTYPGNVKDIGYSVDPGKSFNSLLARGKGSSGPNPLTTLASDTNSQQIVGLREATKDYPNVSNLTQLQNFAESDLGTYKMPVILHTVEFDGGGNTSAPQVGSFHIGDTIRVVATGFELYQDIDQVFRIDQIKIDIGENDEETVTLAISLPSF